MLDILLELSELCLKEDEKTEDIPYEGGSRYI